MIAKIVATLMFCSLTVWLSVVWLRFWNAAHLANPDLVVLMWTQTGECVFHTLGTVFCLILSLLMLLQVVGEYVQSVWPN
jgi:hypothetical protein